MRVKKESIVVGTGILIFALGVFFGNNFDIIKNYAMASIDQLGGLFSSNSNATNSNATNSNATNSNATNSNATNSNATNSNATNSNATGSDAPGEKIIEPSDNLFIPNKFLIGNGTVSSGSRVDVLFESTGAVFSQATIVYYSEVIDASFTTTMYKDQNGFYFVIPNNISNGTYKIQSIDFEGLNSDDTTFNSLCTKENGKLNMATENFSDSIVIRNAEVVNLSLSTLSLKNQNLKLTDSVYIEYTSLYKITQMSLVFKNKNSGKIVSFYIYSLESNPYFIIPNNTPLGEYSLTQISLSDGNNNNYINSSFPIDIVIDSKEENNNSGKDIEIIYSNEDINNEALTNIFNAPKKSEIVIVANNNPFIKSDVFNSVKGVDKNLLLYYKNNQIIFNGKDITNVKAIDATININKSIEDKKIGKLIKNGIVLNFANNGQLPGKATVRIKVTNEIKELLGNDPVYIYFYKESKNKFSLIAEKVKLDSEGFYSFEITHNSQYVMTTDKIVSQYVDVEDTAAFQKSNTSYILILFGVSLLIIIGIVIFQYFKDLKKKEIEII